MKRHPKSARYHGRWVLLHGTLCNKEWNPSLFSNRFPSSFWSVGHLHERCLIANNLHGFECESKKLVIRNLLMRAGYYTLNRHHKS